MVSDYCNYLIIIFCDSPQFVPQQILLVVPHSTIWATNPTLGLRIYKTSESNFFVSGALRSAVSVLYSLISRSVYFLVLFPSTSLIHGWLCGTGCQTFRLQGYYSSDGAVLFSEPPISIIYSLISFGLSWLIGKEIYLISTRRFYLLSTAGLVLQMGDLNSLVLRHNQPGKCFTAGTTPAFSPRTMSRPSSTLLQRLRLWVSSASNLRKSYLQSKVYRVAVILSAW